MVVFWLGGATAPLAPPLATAMDLFSARVGSRDERGRAKVKYCYFYSVYFQLAAGGAELVECP